MEWGLMVTTVMCRQLSATVWTEGDGRRREADEANSTK